MKRRDKTIFTDSAFAEHRAFWKRMAEVHENQFALGRATAEKPRDFETIQFCIDGKFYQLLAPETGAHELKIFVRLLSALSILFNRYTRQADVIIDTPLSVLNISSNMDALTVPLVIEVSGDHSLEDFLKQVRDVARDTYAYQNFPLELMGDDDTPPFRSDVILVYKSLHAAFTDYSAYNTAIIVESTPDGLRISMHYNAYARLRVRPHDIQKHLFKVLHYFTTTQTKLASVDILPEHESSFLDLQNSRQRRDFKTTGIISYEIEQRAVDTPDAVAMVFENNHITYRELNQRANQVAHYIQNQAPGAPVIGILFEHSDVLVICIIGVLKAGRAYLTIDIHLPEHRKNIMLRDAGVQLLLTSQDTEHLPEGTYIERVNDIDIFDRWSKQNPDVGIQPDDLAYVLYTSGSSGQPKGVMINHCSVVNLLEALKSEFQLGSSWRFILTSSISFDAAIKQIFGPLTMGAELHVIRDIRMIGNIMQYVSEAKINAVHLSPEVWKAVVHQETVLPNFDAVQLVSSGGDVLHGSLVGELARRFKRATVANTYGPTEICVNAVVHKSVAPLDPVPIGVPLSNYEIYILDDFLNKQPVGVAGQICISGIGVGRGYLNQPEQTAEKFIANPFNEHSILYLTGDLGAWRPDGTIDFIGREDAQVKIRGNRVELEEIQKTILRHPHVSDSKVLVKTFSEDEKQIIAFVVASRDINERTLAAYLSNELPAYMLPSDFHFLEAMPLHSNGKLNMAALHKLSDDRLVSQAGYEPATNEIEAHLILIWEKLLDRRPIGIHNRFLDLGGHSLKAVRLMGEVFNKFKVSVGLREILANPDIKTLAQRVSRPASQVYQSVPVIEEQEYYELSAAQRELWITHHFQDKRVGYNMVGAYIIEGHLDPAVFAKAVRFLVARHEALRTTFITVDDLPKQKISQWPSLDVVSNYLDLRSYAQQEEQCQELIAEETTFEFDLQNFPLMRVRLIHRQDHEFLLLINMHHLLTDGWSNDIMLSEMLTAYRAYASGVNPDLPELKVQYKDFAGWQNTWHRLSPSQSPDAVVWNDTPMLRLPFDHKPQNIFSGNGKRLSAKLSDILTDKVRSFASQRGYSLNAVLLSLYNIVLWKWCDQEDFTVGIVSSGRSRLELENIVGAFVTFLSVRSELKGGFTYNHYLEKFNKHLQHVLTGQEIYATNGKEAAFTGKPAYRTLFNYHSWSVNSLSDPQFSIREYEFEQPVSVVDIKADIFDNSLDITVSLEYNTDLFEESSIEALMSRYVDAINAVLDQPSLTLSDLRLHSQEEDLLLVEKRTANSHEGDILSINLYASFVIEPSVEYLKYWLDNSELRTRIRTGLYNQVFQQLIAKAAQTGGKNTLNIIYVRFEDYLREMAGLEEVAQVARLRSLFHELSDIIAMLSHSPEEYLVCILPVNRESFNSTFLYDEVVNLNGDWKLFLSNKTNVRTVDCSSLGDLYEVENIVDPAADKIGHIPYTQEFYAALGTYTARLVVGMKSPEHKVIVVDCDNTLWRGVCGEDGVQGIRIEEGHQYLQHFLVKKYDEGFLLALSSKNNESDVWEVFEQHPDMVLKRHHFICSKVNWLGKPDNILEIAEALNLRSDSFIFIDDSPVEIEEMLTRRPEVLSLQLPANNGEFKSFLNHVWAFDKHRITREDSLRNDTYRSELARKEHAQNYVSVHDFIKSLDVRVELRPIQGDMVARASQLTFRTNQFNINGVRLTEFEINALLKRDNVKCRVIGVSDRFGDYGLTGVIIFRHEKDVLQLTNFLLSCRVLGRGVEYAVLSQLYGYCNTHGIRLIDIAHVPTGKNGPVKSFLDELKTRGSAKGTGYAIEVETLSAWDHHYTVESSL